MADKSQSKKEQAAKPAGFDKGPRDFFRGSQGFNNFKNAKANNRTFIGMRRGSR